MSQSDRTDAELIESCLAGDGQAWEILVNRYKRLIYSIPFKCGLQRDDAMEIFQSVWLDCFQELRLLRDVDRLQAWLVRIAVRKCYRLRQRDKSSPEMLEIMDSDGLTEDPGSGLIQKLDREQMIRIGLEKLTARCKEVLEALFFEEPPPSYSTIASRLGLSPNSIGFTRDRCLERLGKLLEEQGYEH